MFTLRSQFSKQSRPSWHAEHHRKNYLISCAQALVRANNGVTYADVIDHEGFVVFRKET